MNARSKQAQAARARIDDFCAVPTLQRQLVTLAVAAAAMLCISAMMVYLGLI